MSTKKILITGATGFIGSYLVRYLLQQGHSNLRCTRQQNSSLALLKDAADKVEWANADLLDIPALEEAMQGVEQVYHCAAIVSFHEKDNRNMLKINREGTANVVNLALDFGIEKLVHVSSVAAIGRKPNDPTIDEQTTWQDAEYNSPYGVSKHWAEMEVWRGIAEGLNAVIVNPANVLGSGFWKGRTSTGQIFHNIWKGLRFHPLGTSGFVDVRDVVRFMVLLMESEVSGERFILSAESLPFKRLFDEIAASVDVGPPTIPVTPLIREVAWRVAWLSSKITGQPPFITKQTARSSARTFFYDNRKSLTVFPFQYTPVSQTVQETGAQFLRNAKKDFEPDVLPFGVGN
ncbi:MAG: NAD-dependent epimerase/dehydratase family protein [Saprospiraceae bacterium]|nr:NAD-dependent epimerase/dehydratase family protein [Saprospiraceae bacterium]